MDKESGQVCPKCFESTLDVFYGESSDDPQAAKCNNCEMQGIFVGKKLIELVLA